MKRTLWVVAALAVAVSGCVSTTQVPLEKHLSYKPAPLTDQSLVVDKAVMTLAGYWSSDPELITAPFSSGRGLMLRDLENQPERPAIIGCTDMAMRKYVPPEILCLTARPAHFEKMMTVPDGSFLFKTWWNDLMKSRGL